KYIIMSSPGNNIRVVCRFRPQNSREIREGGVPIINYDDNDAFKLFFRIEKVELYEL
ncbi:10107_t:CDS:2, partial [Scutellospora calospora]